MKTTFNLDNIDFKFADDGRSVIYDTEYYYLIDDEQLCIDKGTKSDGASIPRLFWRSLGSPFVGKHRRACLGHDDLYSKNYKNRKFCDKFMLQLMKEDGVGFIRRQLIYQGVRMGGWVAWNNHKKRIEKEKLSHLKSVIK